MRFLGRNISYLTVLENHKQMENHKHLHLHFGYCFLDTRGHTLKEAGTLLKPRCSFGCQSRSSQDTRACSEHVSIGCVLVPSSGGCPRKIPFGRNSHYADEEIHIMRGHDGVEILIRIYGFLK